MPPSDPLADQRPWPAAAEGYRVQAAQLVAQAEALLDELLGGYRRDKSLIAGHGPFIAAYLNRVARLMAEAKAVARFSRNAERYRVQAWKAATEGLDLMREILEAAPRDARIVEAHGPFVAWRLAEIGRMLAEAGIGRRT